MNTKVSKLLTVVGLFLSLTANATVASGGGGDATVIKALESGVITAGEDNLLPKCKGNAEYCLKFVFMAIDIYAEVKHKEDSQSKQIAAHMASALRAGLTIYSGSFEEEGKLSRFDDKNIAFNPAILRRNLSEQRVVIAHAFIGTQGAEVGYELSGSLMSK